MMPFSTLPEGTLPGQRTIAGARSRFGKLPNSPPLQRIAETTSDEDGAVAGR